jgi:hypothetical protein
MTRPFWHFVARTGVPHRRCRIRRFRQPAGTHEPRMLERFAMRGVQKSANIVRERWRAESAKFVAGARSIEVASRHLSCREYAAEGTFSGSVWLCAALGRSKSRCGRKLRRRGVTEACVGPSVWSGDRSGRRLSVRRGGDGSFARSQVSGTGAAAPDRPDSCERPARGRASRAVRAAARSAERSAGTRHWLVARGHGGDGEIDHGFHGSHGWEAIGLAGA